MSFLCTFVGIYAVIIGLFVLGIFSDRIVVFLLRQFHVPLFPTAVGIAVSIVEHPEEWTASKFELRHPDIGSIWTANAAYGIKIETNFGIWEPNRIERRIIREAVDWRIQDYVRNRIAMTMQRRSLQ